MIFGTKFLFMFQLPLRNSCQLIRFPGLMCVVIYQCCFLCNASRADFSEEPAFSWIRKLPADIRTAIHHSKILFCNGYAFDEFFPDVIASSIDCAIDSGTAVFFDPGPRGKSLLHGTLDEQRALEHALRFSDVLLLTSDEVSWHTCCSSNLLVYRQVLFIEE